jgi:hypothetical protein
MATHSGCRAAIPAGPEARLTYGGFGKLRLALSVVAWLAVAAPVPDSKNIPPKEREYFSADRNYSLRLRTPDEWKTKKVVAQLLRRGNATLWSTILPQEYGPRFAVVGNDGAVLLFDEWIDVASPLALVLLDSRGQIAKQTSFQELARLLNVPGNPDRFHGKLRSVDAGRAYGRHENRRR